MEIDYYSFERLDYNIKKSYIIFLVTFIDRKKIKIKISIDDLKNNRELNIYKELNNDNQ